jgi:hypothetical protein
VDRSLRITTHKKRFGNIEVRLYVPRVRSGWHRMGTLSLSGVAWRIIVRPILLAGAERTGIRVTMENATLDPSTADDGLADPSREHPAATESAAGHRRRLRLPEGRR